MIKWLKTSVIVLGIGLGVGVMTCALRLFYRKNEEETMLEIPNRTKRQMKIPKSFVGLVLGRGGATINDIRQKTKTRIKIEDTDKDFTTATIIGDESEVEEAIKLISRIMNGRPVMTTTEISIPSKFSDLLIGKNGVIIRSICHETRAKITVDWTPSKENGASLKVIIKGRKEEVDSAIEVIDKIIADAEVQSNNLVHVAGRALPEKPLPSNISHENPTVPCEKLIPSSGDGYIEVYISALVTPSRFWVQISGPKAIQTDKLSSEMTDFYEDEKHNSKYKLKTVKTDDIVAAFFDDDNIWYRARVLNVSHAGGGDSNTQVDIFYVDFGDFATVDLDLIRVLRKEYLSIPFQAIECCLARVEPIEESWSQEAIGLFQRLVKLAQWKVILAKPIELDGKSEDELASVPQQLVSLYDTSTNKDIDIEAELVQYGFARYNDQFKINENSNI